MSWKITNGFNIFVNIISTIPKQIERKFVQSNFFGPKNQNVGHPLPQTKPPPDTGVNVLHSFRQRSF